MVPETDAVETCRDRAEGRAELGGGLGEALREGRGRAVRGLAVPRALDELERLRVEPAAPEELAP